MAVVFIDIKPPEDKEKRKLYDEAVEILERKPEGIDWVFDGWTEEEIMTVLMGYLGLEYADANFQRNLNAGKIKPAYTDENGNIIGKFY